MSQTHTFADFTFKYPDDWTIEEHRTDTEISLMISSSGAEFLSITLYSIDVDPAELTRAAVDAFREEYKELDAYPTKGTICGAAAEAVDLDFVCLDMVNMAFVRSFQTDGYTVFLLCQGGGTELNETRAAFKLITESLASTDEDFPFPFGDARE